MPGYSQEMEANQFDDDYLGMDDFESFNQQTEKTSVLTSEDFLTSQYKEIALVLDKEIDAIVKASQPKGDLIYLSGKDRVKFIDEWRQNIFDNLKALAKTKNAFGSNEYYSKDRADYYEKRKSQIEATESGRSNKIDQLKADKKSGITNVKQARTEKSIGFMDGFKQKREIRKNFRHKKHIVNSDAKTESEKLTKGDAESEDEQSKKPLRQLYGVLEGKTNKEDQNTINPFEDFQLQEPSTTIKYPENREADSSPQFSNLTNYVYFDLLEISSLDDITPLLAPRARDSIIDKGTTLPGDNDFKLYPELAAVNDNAAFREVTGKYFNSTTGTETINTADSSNNVKVKEAKKNWEKSETEKTTKTLEEDYVDLYGLELKSNESDNSNRNENIGVDDRGNVTPKAKDHFNDWLSKHATDKSLGVIWNSEELKFTAVKQEGKDKESENTANEERAKSYNNIIKKTELKPSDLDLIKRDILVGLSKSLINEQKWQGRDLSGGSSSEWKSAGEAKEDNAIYGAQKNTEGETFMVSKFVEAGTYKQTPPKRNSKYDEKTGYRKSPEETIIPDDNWVDEKINWKVDYKVRVRERTDY